MIEVTVKKYLADNLQNIPVLFERPKTKPNRYVLIHEIDAGKTNEVRAITLEFICGAKSYYSARELCGQVRRLLELSAILPSISSAKIGGENGGYNENNSDYEYDLIFNFTHFEED